MRASLPGAHSQCARCPATLSFPGSVPSWPSATRPRWRPPDRPRRTPVGRGKHRTGAGWRTPETSPPPAPSETNADEGVAGESKHAARSAQAPLATGTRAAIESLARGFAFPAMRHPGLLRRRRPGSSEPSKERDEPAEASRALEACAQWDSARTACYGRSSARCASRALASSVTLSGLSHALALLRSPVCDRPRWLLERAERSVHSRERWSLASCARAVRPTRATAPAFQWQDLSFSASCPAPAPLAVSGPSFDPLHVRHIAQAPPSPTYRAQLYFARRGQLLLRLFWPPRTCLPWAHPPPKARFPPQRSTEPLPPRATLEKPPTPSPCSPRSIRYICRPLRLGTLEFAFSLAQLHLVPSSPSSSCTPRFPLPAIVRTRHVPRIRLR